jgi:hypothetical protein
VYKVLTSNITPIHVFVHIYLFTSLTHCDLCFWSIMWQFGGILRHSVFSVCVRVRARVCVCVCVWFKNVATLILMRRPVFCWRWMCVQFGCYDSCSQSMYTSVSSKTVHLSLDGIDLQHCNLGVWWNMHQFKGKHFCTFTPWKRHSIILIMFSLCVVSDTVMRFILIIFLQHTLPLNNKYLFIKWWSWRC